ncbi:MAG: hypothetical protein VKL58_04550 [Cyanobacteriota bacterium]|jgi:hypothetical protein|nr:hypothetical protein [Cyanobacteriota bacterium]
MDPAFSARGQSPELDAINLMLRDLNTRHDEIRHRAAFRGCTGELLVLQKELVDYLLSRKQELLGHHAASSQPVEGKS